MLKQTIILFITAAGLATPSFAQSPNLNQAAVDTLTKDVAMAVFANQRGDKAAEIFAQLASCIDGCDAVSVIKNVGGWDAVGVKMEELGRLKNTAPFQAMSPGDANAAIRREFARFYVRYKSDKNYGVPLNQGVQTQILAKIDGLLPPDAPQSAPTVTEQPAAGQAEQVDVAEGANVDGQAVQISQLERTLKEERTNRMWMIVLSALAGLLAGAGVVYLTVYRSLKKEVDRLTQDNRQAKRDLDETRRSRPGNAPRQPQPENRVRTDTYAVPPKSASTVTPVDPETAKTPVASPNVESGTPVPESSGENEPAPDQTVTTEPVPVPTPVRSEVFYFPPPDPNGQFDNAQRADALSPESAYWFSTDAESPDVATFRFEAEPGRVARFLTYRNYMIEPACDSENSFSSTYTRIVNRRNGEAVLENGAWRVKTKALIRYE